MTRDTRTIIIFLGVVYLCIGLGAFISPAMFMFYATRNDLVSAPFLKFLGTLVLIYGPCFLIAYAWIRRRKWGRYLLVAYNGLWFAYMSYAFVARMINYSESYLVLVIAGFLIPLIVLGGAYCVRLSKRCQGTHELLDYGPQRGQVP